jgi:hypothetical protein
MEGKIRQGTPVWASANIVETSHKSKVTVVWNQQVKADRTIPNNKADIIIHINDKGTCLLIDITISGDRNVIKKDFKR